jgi:hypothetical protein
METLAWCEDQGHSSDLRMTKKSLNHDRSALCVLAARHGTTCACLGSEVHRRMNASRGRKPDFAPRMRNKKELRSTDTEDLNAPPSMLQ